MRGGSHLATGVASAAVVMDSYILLHSVSAGPLANQIANAVAGFLMDNTKVVTIPMLLYVPLCLIFYMLGTIIPDVDSPYSMVGKRFYLPIPHRTWTHCWLPLLVFGILGFFARPSTFLCIGIFVHMFFDSFSASGVYWLYPLKFKIRCPIYHTGSPTEYIFATLVCVASVVYSVFAVQHVYHIFDPLLYGSI